MHHGLGGRIGPIVGRCGRIRKPDPANDIADDICDGRRCARLRGMSGGSHDYFYRRLEDGSFVDTDHIDGLMGSLGEYIKGCDGDGQTYEGGSWRRFSAEEQGRMRTRGAAVLAALQKLKETCEDARRQAATLVDVAQSLEWADSGDTCADDVLRAVTERSVR